MSESPIVRIPHRPSNKQTIVKNRLARVADWYSPVLSEMPASRRELGAGQVIIFLFFAPSALLGIIWLPSVTTLQTVRSNLSQLLLIGALATLLDRLKYLIVGRFQSTRIGSTEGSLTIVAIVSGLFIIGPLVLWIPVLLTVFQLLVH